MLYLCECFGHPRLAPTLSLVNLKFIAQTQRQDRAVISLQSICRSLGRASRDLQTRVLVERRYLCWLEGARRTQHYSNVSGNTWVIIESNIEKLKAIVSFVSNIIVAMKHLAALYVTHCSRTEGSFNREPTHHHQRLAQIEGRDQDLSSG